MPAPCIINPDHYSSADRFAVMVVRRGAWAIWSTHHGADEAKREMDYLICGLGLHAETFERTV